MDPHNTSPAPKRGKYETSPYLQSLIAKPITPPRSQDLPFTDLIGENDPLPVLDDAKPANKPPAPSMDLEKTPAEPPVTPRKGRLFVKPQPATSPEPAPMVSPTQAPLQVPVTSPTPVIPNDGIKYAPPEPSPIHKPIMPPAMPPWSPPVAREITQDELRPPGGPGPVPPPLDTLPRRRAQSRRGWSLPAGDLYTYAGSVHPYPWRLTMEDYIRHYRSSPPEQHHVKSQGIRPVTYHLACIRDARIHGQPIPKAVTACYPYMVAMQRRGWCLATIAYDLQIAGKAPVPHIGEVVWYLDDLELPMEGVVFDPPEYMNRGMSPGWFMVVPGLGDTEENRAAGRTLGPGEWRSRPYWWA